MAQPEKTPPTVKTTVECADDDHHGAGEAAAAKDGGDADSSPPKRPSIPEIKKSPLAEKRKVAGYKLTDAEREVADDVDKLQVELQRAMSTSVRKFPSDWGGSCYFFFFARKFYVAGFTNLHSGDVACSCAEQWVRRI